MTFTHITMMGKVWGMVGFLMKIVLLLKRHFKLHFYFLGQIIVHFGSNLRYKDQVQLFD